MKKHTNGFTVVEIILAVLVLSILTFFFIDQKANLQKTSRDQQRKIAINTMSYALQKGFYKQYGYYPRTISRDNLKTVDPVLFTDPNGNTLNGDSCNQKDANSDSGCDYHYVASDCDNEGRCKQFALTSQMELEQTYRKSSIDK